MAKTRLDQAILAKIAEKTEKDSQYVREQISRKASRMAVSSEAAQVLWAKELGVSTSRFQRSLPPHINEEIRTSLPGLFARRSQGGVRGNGQRAVHPRPVDQVRLAVDYLLQDRELKDRCGDLIRAGGHFDRVVREATTVLDDRLKTLAGITGKMNPVDVVGKAVNPDPAKAVLKVSNDRDEQEGFFSICKGLMLAFRNPAHHRLTNRFSRQDALRFCGFVDTLLAALGGATIQSPTP